MDTKALFNLSYGLYIVSAKKEGRLNGQIANTVFQVSGAPNSVAVSINKQNLTHEFIQASRLLTVSILAQSAPLSLIGHFGFKSGREADKFAGANFNYKIGENGLFYVTDHTNAFIEAKVIREMDANTHTVFLAEVTDAAVLSSEPSMTYAYYHQIKRGAVPKTAPLPEVEKPAADRVIKAPRYRCTVCGYVYDPEIGDPENGVAPGTPFEKLPEDWTCPICGATKDLFEKED